MEAEANNITSVAGLPSVSNKDRTAAAFWIAPLWIPLVFSPLLFNIGNAWILAIIFELIFSYAGTWVLGFPAYKFLSRRHAIPLWWAILYGAVVANITSLCFAVFFTLWLDGFHYLSNHTTFQPTSATGIAILGSACLGGLVGATIWLIARPDRVYKAGSVSVLA